MSLPRKAFLAGARAELPILIGVVPFGLVYGFTIRSGHVPVDIGLGMSSIVFAGSAQVIGAQLISKDTPFLIIGITMAIVNLRHMLYSASVAPYLKHLRPIWRYVLAYLLTDEAYAVAIAHYTQTDAEAGEHGAVSPFRHWYFLGAGLALWATWQASTAFGIFVGGEIPPRWNLGFTLALTFIALVVPVIKDRAIAMAAISAGIVSVLAYGLPYRLGLMAAAFVGIVVGLWVESRDKRVPLVKEVAHRD